MEIAFTSSMAIASAIIFARDTIRVFPGSLRPPATPTVNSCSITRRVVPAGAVPACRDWAAEQVAPDKDVDLL